VVACLEMRAVGKTTFRRLWRQLVPYVVRTRPMTDLCWECQRNNEALYRSANLPDSVKSAKVIQQQQHLTLVHEERSIYNSMVHDAKLTVAAAGIETLACNEPCSNDFAMHYSFDFAQQVHYPSSPLQPGPMYFLVPRKCGIFGVCCEALPQQVNYLIDEGMCTSKGSNAVISYLHHFFGKWGLGETELHLHCDNCSGQNKNKFMLWYLCWRIICKLHRSATLNFMISGHTKFAPDWCFGLLKQRYRRTAVSSLADIAGVVDSSTVVGVNRAEIVGTEDGQVNVPTFDWQAYFQTFFKPFPGIKSIQHFRFSADCPGIVFYRATPSSEEQSFQMLRDLSSMPTSVGPAELAPPGLPFDRQWYLYQKIREFVSSSAQDTTCPKPESPIETAIVSQHTSAAVAGPSTSASATSVPPQTKRKRPTSHLKQCTKTSKHQTQRKSKKPTGAHETTERTDNVVSVSQSTNPVSLPSSSTVARRSSRSRSGNVRLSDFCI